MAKDKTTKLLDLIAKAESAPAGGYEAIVGSKTGIKGLKNKTIKEVLEIQNQRLKEGKNTAIGRYQIINKTLKEAIKKTGISEDSLFNEETQDKLGKSLLEKRGLSKYLSGKIDSVKFGNNLAKEWAGLPVLNDIKDKKRGQSYYKGVGDNKAIISPEELEKILNSNEEPMAKEKEQKSLLGPLKSLQYENEAGIDMVMQGIQPEAREKLQMNIEKDSTMANVQKDPKQEVAKMIQEQKVDRQPASESSLTKENIEQTRSSLDQGFKDALMYFGPRLGAMILGGTEAAEITDRVMTGFEKYQAGKQPKPVDAKQDLAERKFAFEQQKFATEQQQKEAAQQEKEVAKQEQKETTMEELNSRLNTLLESRRDIETMKDVTGPVVGSAPARYVQSAMGVPQESARRRLETISMMQQLERTKVLKGALSNKELDFLAAGLPKVTDDPALWKDWLDKRIPILEKGIKNLGGQKQQDASNADILKKYGLE